jgi:hypothetical protein
MGWHSAHGPLLLQGSGLCVWQARSPVHKAAQALTRARRRSIAGRRHGSGNSAVRRGVVVEEGGYSPAQRRMEALALSPAVASTAMACGGGGGSEHGGGRE